MNHRLKFKVLMLYIRGCINMLLHTKFHCQPSIKRIVTVSYELNFKHSSCDYCLEFLLLMDYLTIVKTVSFCNYWSIVIVLVCKHITKFIVETRSCCVCFSWQRHIGYITEIRTFELLTF